MSQDLSILLQPAIEMSEPEKEFRQWLVQCRSILSGRSPDEVAETAIRCGFEKPVVFGVLAYFHNAMRGTSFEGVLQMQSLRFDMTNDLVQRMKREINRPKELDLMPLWKDVTAYQIGA